MTVKQRAEKLYKNAGVFFLSCIGSDGHPYTKAVLPGKLRDSIEEIYFCTNTSSSFASAVSKNSKASVYFYSKLFVWKGCLLTGEMQIVEDIKIKERYWQKKFKNAYPEKSFNDPDFCVLKFIYSKGRFYESYRPQDFD